MKEKLDPSEIKIIEDFDLAESYNPQMTVSEMGNLIARWKEIQLMKTKLPKIRYFLIIGVLVNDHFHYVVSGEKYPSLTDIIKKANEIYHANFIEDYSSSVMVTNIIELTKNDYDDFIK